MSQSTATTDPVEATIRARCGDPSKADLNYALATLRTLQSEAASEVRAESEFRGSSWEAAVLRHQMITNAITGIESTRR